MAGEPIQEERYYAEVQKIFSDQGETILQLGKKLAKGIPPKKASQLRKFLTELQSIKRYDLFKLNRFCWNCKYIVARDANLEDVGKYLYAAAQEVHGDEAEEKLKYLKAFAQSIYAQYCFYKGET